MHGYGATDSCFITLLINLHFLRMHKLIISLNNQSVQKSVCSYNYQVIHKLINPRNQKMFQIFIIILLNSLLRKTS